MQATKGGLNIFRSDFLGKLQEVAGTTFDKDDSAHLRRERELSAGAWAKTEYWLKQVAKRTNPLFEVGIRKNVRQTPTDDYVFYEIKALSSLKACLREALGQLLEYACWPTGLQSAEWVIVAKHPPTPESEAYLTNLRQRFNLPVTYRQVVPK